MLWFSRLWYALSHQWDKHYVHESSETLFYVQYRPIILYLFAHIVPGEVEDRFKLENEVVEKVLVTVLEKFHLAQCVKMNMNS